MTDIDPVSDETAEPEGSEGLVDKLRNMGVGTEDPNIIGNAGPTDVAPGTDPPAGASDR